jgi:hypothetical protein
VKNYRSPLYKHKGDLCETIWKGILFVVCSFNRHCSSIDKYDGQVCRYMNSIAFWIICLVKVHLAIPQSLDRAAHETTFTLSSTLSSASEPTESARWYRCKVAHNEHQQLVATCGPDAVQCEPSNSTTWTDHTGPTTTVSSVITTATAVDTLVTTTTSTLPAATANAEIHRIKDLPPLTAIGKPKLPSNEPVKPQIQQLPPLTAIGGNQNTETSNKPKSKEPRPIPDVIWHKNQVNRPIKHPIEK